MFNPQKNSSIPGSGEGLFLRRDAPAHHVVSLYSGLMFDYPDEALIYITSKVTACHMACTLFSKQDTEELFFIEKRACMCSVV
jgi:hypothetical protein